MKIFFRNIHLYLSLAAGIVIAIVCFTGAALVFEKEMLQTLYPDRYRVAASGPRLSLDQLVARLQQAKPQAQVTGVKVFGDPSRTVELNFIEEKAEGPGSADKAAKAGEGPGREKGGAGPAGKGGGHK